MAEGTGLLAQLRTALRIRHYSRATEAAYTSWVRRYVRFHGLRHPATLDADAIASFIADLADRQRVSASTQTQALAALLFFYRHVLQQDVGWVAALRAKAPVRLPVVLSREHVRAVLDGLSGDKRLAAMLLYGSGLRLMECLRLRLQDLDVERGERRARVPAGRLRAEEPAGGACTAVAVAVSGGAHAGGPVGRTVAHAPASERGTACGHGVGPALGHRAAGDLPRIPALVRDASAGGWLRHPDGAGAAGPQRRIGDDGVHARAESRRTRGEESVGPTLGQRQPVEVHSVERSLKASAILDGQRRRVGRACVAARRRCAWSWICVAVGGGA
jgi:hypothetical protein